MKNLNINTYKYGVLWYKNPLKISQVEDMIIYVRFSCICVACNMLSFHTRTQFLIQAFKKREQLTHREQKQYPGKLEH